MHPPEGLYEIIEECKLLNLSDNDLEEFLSLLKIHVNIQEFQQQMQDVFEKIIGTA